MRDSPLAGSFASRWGAARARRMSRVLIVEDQAAVANALRVLFDVHELAYAVAKGPEEALRLVSSGEVGVVVQDMNFSPSATSGEEGTELFHAIRRIDPQMPVVLMTAWTSLEAAVTLVREGANDYIAKPWDDAKLLATVRNLLKLRALEKENERLKRARCDSREALAKRHDLKGIVYESEAMHRLVSLAVQIAPADVPVLVTGPNGVGKEKLADIIQANSRRRTKPFVKVNAGALPEGLLEAELFGAEAGAYTGSTKLRIGRFETAQGGTVFLDEIGTLSPAGQVRLLRVLQTGDFERVGSSETRQADVRILCATNADLPKAIAEGRFREDLYFRLNVIELDLPPLRDRPEDILPLARHALAPLRSASGAPLSLSREAERALLAHAWPGNVRELLNRIQRASLVADAPELTPVDLGLAREETPRDARSPEEEKEREELERVLTRTDGSVSRAASELGLSRQALYRKMERLGITLERRPR
jgi:DNA-binding NtrC family response regulator